MIVSRVSDFTAIAASPPLASSRQNLTPKSAISADTVSISQEARDLWATTQYSMAKKGVQVQMDATGGATMLDLDAYFTPPDTQKTYSNTLPPLLSPTQKNIEALADDISQKMPEFLSKNNIPFAPPSISYDSRGQIQLPDDYPHAQAFQEALEQDPVLERQLRTVAALSSTLVAINKSIPFQQEYATATSQAQINAVIAKYSHLFSGQSFSDNIALTFTPEGILTPSQDQQPLFTA